MTVQQNGIPIFEYAYPRRALKKLPHAAAVFALMLCYCTGSDTFSSSGTIIFVQFTNDRFLVGAESRGFGDGVDPRDPHKRCKITPLGDKMFFVMTGKIKGFDKNKAVVDTHAGAEHACEQLRSAPNTSKHIKDVADRWAKIMVSEFTQWSRLDQGEFLKDVSEGNLGLAVFAGTTGDGTLVAYGQTKLPEAVA